MTLHLTATYLWVFLGIVWFVGVVLGNLVLQGLYMDDYPPKWVFILPLIWPVVLPLWIVYGFLMMVFFRPWL